MTLDIESLIPVVVALVGSAGLWSFMSSRAKLSHERAMKDTETRAQFNETLKLQVEALSVENKQLYQKVEELLKEMACVRSELAESRATIKHLEEVLRNRGNRP